jgi:probable lipoprotein NlpC
MKMPSDLSWVNGYLGLPYFDKGRTRAGVDCWGPPCIVYLEQLGIELPSYDDRYANAAERAEISAIVAEAAASPTWTKIDRPRAFDIAVFKLDKGGSHVGLVVEPGQMLHVVEAGDFTHVEAYDGLRWGNRLLGIFRHRELLERIP